jgi:hypothetical protein
VNQYVILRPDGKINFGHRANSKYINPVADPFKSFKNEYVNMKHQQQCISLFIIPWTFSKSAKKEIREIIPLMILKEGDAEISI